MPTLDDTLALHIFCSPGRMYAAAFHDNLLIDFAYHAPFAPDGWGDQLLGRITKYMPGLNGAFVDIGQNSLPGFLPDTREQEWKQEGDYIPVSVIRSAQNGKGPRLAFLSGAPNLTERTVQLIKRGPSPIEILCQRYPNAKITIDSLHYLTMLAGPIQKRCHTVASPFHYTTLYEQIENLLTPEIFLENGMRIIFSPTPAAVIVDMDTASATEHMYTKASTQFALNRDSLPVILRHIQMRNYSGAILLDLAGLSLKKRKPFGTYIISLLQKDPLPLRFLGFSALGFAEFLRSRQRPAFHEQYSSPYGKTLECLFQIWKQTFLFPSFPSQPITCGAGLYNMLASHNELLHEFFIFSGYTFSPLLSHDLAEFAWKL